MPPTAYQPAVPHWATFSRSCDVLADWVRCWPQFALFLALLNSRDGADTGGAGITLPFMVQWVVVAIVVHAATGYGKAKFEVISERKKKMKTTKFT